MAGVAAEDYVFGMLSTGGENDLDEATKTAHAMVSVWGMSDAIGPVTVGERPGEIFIAPYSGPGQYGPMILDESGALLWFDPLLPAYNLVNVRFGSQEPGVYVPPRWENGHIVPGHVEPGAQP